MARKKLVSDSKNALYQMKYEIAAEFGLPVVHQGAYLGMDTEFASELGSMPAQPAAHRDDWGHLTSRDAGSVGGEITKRLVTHALRQK